MVQYCTVAQVTRIARFNESVPLIWRIGDMIIGMAWVWVWGCVSEYRYGGDVQVGGLAT